MRRAVESEVTKHVRARADIKSWRKRTKRWIQGRTTSSGSSRFLSQPSRTLRAAASPWPVRAAAGSTLRTANCEREQKQACCWAHQAHHRLGSSAWRYQCALRAHVWLRVFQSDAACSMHSDRHLWRTRGIAARKATSAAEPRPQVGRSGRRLSFKMESSRNTAASACLSLMACTQHDCQWPYLVYR